MMDMVSLFLFTASVGLVSFCWLVNHMQGKALYWTIMLFMFAFFALALAYPLSARMLGLSALMLGVASTPILWLQREG